MIGMNDKFIDNFMQYMELGYSINSSLEQNISSITDTFLKSDIGVYQSLLSQSFIIKHIFKDEATDLKDVGIYGVELLVSTSFRDEPVITINSILVDTSFFSCQQHIYNFPELSIYDVKIISAIKKNYLHISDNVIETISLKNISIDVLDIKNLNQYNMYKLAHIKKVKVIQLSVFVPKDNFTEFIELLTNLLIDVDNFRGYSGELNVSVYFEAYSDECFLMFKEELRDSLKYYKYGNKIYNSIDKDISYDLEHNIKLHCWKFNHYKMSKLETIMNNFGVYDE